MSDESLSDHDLIERCLAGENDSWRTLVRRHHGLVYAVLRKMGLSPEDAEDVLQEAFITLLRKLHTVRDRQRLGLWLAVTARRRALDRVDRARYRLESQIPEGYDGPAATPSAVDELLLLERRALVRRALATLPERCRNLLRMLHEEDPTPSYRDIAQRLGVAEGSLGPTRMRCLQKLRAALERIRGWD